MALRVVIIDDEPEILQYIEGIVQQMQDCIVVATCGSVAEGKIVLNNTKPDVLLLDIQLSDGTGFDILEHCNSQQFKVIFITAYNQYALKAIKVGAIDYLLKPFTADELEIAIRKVQVHQQFQHEMLNLSQQVYAGNTPKKIVLRSQDFLQVVNIDDIAYCQSYEGYTTFYFINGGKFLVSKKIKEYDDLLSGCGFVRCHQSYLVNINHIHQLLKEGEILLKNGIAIPVSQRKREEVLDVINNIR